MNKCTRCGGTAKASKILAGDFGDDDPKRGCFGITVNVENLLLVDCTKCSLCGYSWNINKPFVEEELNQCDGCRAGIPVDENGNHRMGGMIDSQGRLSSYSNLQGCQKHKYIQKDESQTNR